MQKVYFDPKAIENERMWEEFSATQVELKDKGNL